MKCTIKNSSKHNFGHLKDPINEFLNFFNEKMPIELDFSIEFTSDRQNSQDLLGKTAYYDPQNKHIVVYVDGRHDKDIMRSLSHELVHHCQNNQKTLDEPQFESGYAQKDDNLRNLEKEAYLKGNMIFRDYEDHKKCMSTTLTDKGINEVKYTDDLNEEEEEQPLEEWRMNEHFENVLEKFDMKFDVDALSEAGYDCNADLKEYLEEEEHDEELERYKREDAAERERRYEEAAAIADARLERQRKAANDANAAQADPSRRDPSRQSDNDFMVTGKDYSHLDETSEEPQDRTKQTLAKLRDTHGSEGEDSDEVARLKRPRDYATNKRLSRLSRQQGPLREREQTMQLKETKKFKLFENIKQDTNNLLKAEAFLQKKLKKGKK